MICPQLLDDPDHLTLSPCFNDTPCFALMEKKYIFIAIKTFLSHRKEASGSLHRRQSSNIWIENPVYHVSLVKMNRNRE